MDGTRKTCGATSSATNPVDARGADWSGQDLGELDLRDAKLCRCDLRGTNLSQCQLEGADLRLARYDQTTLVPEGFALNTSGAVGPGAKAEWGFSQQHRSARDGPAGSRVDGRVSERFRSEWSFARWRFDLAGADLRSATFRGAMCRGTRFGTCEMDMADLRGANLEGAALETVTSIRGADFSLCTGLEDQIGALLSRSVQELDCWNPMTRSTTRRALSP